MSTNDKFCRTLLNLFDRCAEEGRALIIEINRDLLPIYPVAIDLIFSLLSEKIPSIFTSLSNDKKQILFRNSLKLCADDQRKAGDCQSSRCVDLHFCENYLFNNQCLEFQSNGICSHSHSFETKHNEQILRKYFPSDSNQDNPMEFVSHLLRLSIDQDDRQANRPSLTFQMLNQQKLTTKLIDHLFREYRDLIRRQLLLNASTILITFDDDEATSMIEEVFRPSYERTIRIEKSSPFHQVKTTSVSSPSLLINSAQRKGKPIFSTRLRDLSSTTQTRASLSPRLAPPSPRTTSSTDFYFSKAFAFEDLSFLLGPGKYLVDQRYEEQVFPFLASGFCRVENDEQGRIIEEHLNSILPKSLSVEPVAIDQYLPLFIDSPTIERFLSEYYLNSSVIITNPKVIQRLRSIFRPAEEEYSFVCSISVPINVIEEEEDECAAAMEGNVAQLKIEATDSSIRVVEGNICEIPVDLMICISTSINLRESVLRQAGPTVAEKYRGHTDPSKALLTDGGSTAATKILFIPWQDNLPLTDLEAIRQSLFALVQWSIDEAVRRQMKSISFPPIGTGQLDLDPTFVCQTMIDAAVTKLFNIQLDVFFVIYQSNECFQVFRMFLESFTDGRQTKRKLRKKSSSIERVCAGKLLYTLSNRAQTKDTHRNLIKALENLYVEETFDLHSIDRRFSENTDDLIDQCLKYKLYPQIDLVEKKFTVRGDRPSIEQCLYHLRNAPDVHQFAYLVRQKEILFNSFISIQIDQALTNSLPQISVRDDSQRIYHIDLVHNEVSLDDQHEKYPLRKKLLPGLRRSSSSSMMIHQIDIPRSSFSSLTCAQKFRQTMSTSLWAIERIIEIENHRINSFCSLKETDRTEFYFHGASASSVQSIVHYGFHSTTAAKYHDQPTEDSICFTSDAWTSHLNGSQRSTDGTFYLVVAQISFSIGKENRILLSNDQLQLTRPKYFLVYRCLHKNESN